MTEYPPISIAHQRRHGGAREVYHAQSPLEKH